jgi:ABC-type Mn2+/Zn2+ transport system ATPase subunit
MLKSSKGRIVFQKNAKAKISRCFIYIPIDISRDSQFPYTENEYVSVIYDPKTKLIIVEKQESK